MGEAEVHMIAHEAVAEDHHLIVATFLAKEREVALAIDVIGKNLLPVVSALRHVMRDAADHDPCFSGHAKKDNPRNGKNARIGGCPWFSARRF
jgi:hypothetical protein